MVMLPYAPKGAAHKGQFRLKNRSKLITFKIIFFEFFSIMESKNIQLRNIYFKFHQNRIKINEIAAEKLKLCKNAFSMRH